MIQIKSDNVNFRGDFNSFLGDDWFFISHKVVDSWSGIQQKVVPEAWELVDCVYTGVTVNDLWQAVGGGWKSWVVNLNVVSTVSVSQNVVSSVVNVKNNDVSGVKVALDLSIRNLAVEGQTKFVDGSPNKEISTDITSVALQPWVEGGWVVVVSSSGKGHGGGAHQASSLADGVGWSSELFTSPSGITLFVEWVGSGQADDQKEGENKDFHWFMYETDYNSYQINIINI